MPVQGAGGGRRTIVFSAFPLPDGNQGGLCPPQSLITTKKIYYIRLLTYQVKFHIVSMVYFIQKLS